MPVPLGQFETTASGGDLAEADRRLSGEHSSDDAASPGGTLDRNSEDYNSVCIGAGHAQPAARRKSSGKFQLFSRGSKSPTSPKDPELSAGSGMNSGSDSGPPADIEYTNVCIGANHSQPAARRQQRSSKSLLAKGQGSSGSGACFGPGVQEALATSGGSASGSGTWNPLDLVRKRSSGQPKLEQPQAMSSSTPIPAPSPAPTPGQRTPSGVQVRHGPRD